MLKLMNRSQPKIISTKDKNDSFRQEELKILVGGKEVNVGEYVHTAKIIHGGKDVIYDGGYNSGSGGFENEGE